MDLIHQRTRRSHPRKNTNKHEKEPSKASLANKTLPFQLSGGAKIDEHANTQVGRLQVIQELSFFLAREMIQGLDLNNQLPVANEVGTVLFLQAHSLVMNF